MAWSGWCTQDQVRERCRQLTATGGWDDPDIEARADRAMDDLKSWLTPRYGADEVALWDTEGTRPDILDHLTADLAAAYCLADAYGQTPYEPGTAAGNAYARVKVVLDELFSRKRELVLADGTIIGPINTGITLWGSNREETEPVYTMTEKALDKSMPGSLDNY